MERDRLTEKDTAFNGMGGWRTRGIEYPTRRWTRLRKRDWGGREGEIRQRIFIAVSLKFEMMVDVDTVLRGCSACLTVIISDWLSSVAGSSPEDYLSVSASIHPSAAVDISTVLSAPLGYRFELPSASHIYVDCLYVVRLIRLRLVCREFLKPV